MPVSTFLFEHLCDTEKYHVLRASVRSPSNTLLCINK